MDEATLSCVKMFRICSLNLTCFIMLSSIRIFFRTSPCELAIDLAVWKWKLHEDSSHESAGGCWATRIYNDPRRTRFTIPRVQSCGLPQEGQLHPALGVLPTSGLGCRLCPSPAAYVPHDLSQPYVYIYIYHIYYIYIYIHIVISISVQAYHSRSSSAKLLQSH